MTLPGPAAVPVSTLPEKPEPTLARAHAELIVAIGRDADRQAFATLYEYFAPRLKAFLMRAGTPAGNAEDLAQETLLMVWRKAASFDPQRAGASTWIYAIARNLRIDQFRRAEQPEGLELDPSMAPDDPATPAELWETRHREQSVRAAMASLTPEQQQIVKLSFFEEQAHAEIARVLNIPLGTAKSRIRRTLGQLRAMLEALR